MRKTGGACLTQYILATPTKPDPHVMVTTHTNPKAAVYQRISRLQLIVRQGHSQQESTTGRGAFGCQPRTMREESDAYALAHSLHKRSAREDTPERTPCPSLTSSHTRGLRRPPSHRRNSRTHQTRPLLASNRRRRVLTTSPCARFLLMTDVGCPPYDDLVTPAEAVSDSSAASNKAPRSA